MVKASQITGHLKVCSTFEVTSTGLPGKPFRHFQPFLGREKHSSQFIWKAFFLVPLKMPKNALFRAYICNKFPGGGPPDPTCGMEIPPHAPSICTTLWHVDALCHPVPHKKHPANRKKPKNTNFWLKPWLHVTKPDHKEHLRAYRYISMA